LIEVVFETHSISEDNENRVATGWNHGRLSERGRGLAKQLGTRRWNDNLAAVFTSDLGRAVETASLAFEGSAIPILHDWRLRECDYGEWNGRPSEQIHGERTNFLDSPYPGGESWRQATDRVGSFFADLPPRWAGLRVLLIGHIATRWGCDRFLRGIPLEDLIAEQFVWQEGWEYRLDADEFIRKYEAATASHDLEATLELIADDAVYWFSDGGTYHGKDAIAAAIRSNFEAIKDEDYRISDVKWLAVSEDVAACVYSFSWSGMVGGTQTSGSGRGTTVIQKVDGEWRVVHEHLSRGPFGS
jgi:2,3-bisphosphoglycerate-dependent phosphoglycerate mutase